MTKQKRRNAFTSTEDTVSHLVTQAQERKQAEMSDGRGRAGHGKARGVDKRGQAKMTIYVSTTTQEKLREVAAAEDCALGDIAEAAIVALYNAWKDGAVDFYKMRVPARSLKVSWKITVDDNFSLHPTQKAGG